MLLNTIILTLVLGMVNIGNARDNIFLDEGDKKQSQYKITSNSKNNKSTSKGKNNNKATSKGKNNNKATSKGKNNNQKNNSGSSGGKGGGGNNVNVSNKSTTSDDNFQITNAHLTISRDTGNSGGGNGSSGSKSSNFSIVSSSNYNYNPPAKSNPSYSNQFSFATTKGKYEMGVDYVEPEITMPGGTTKKIKFGLLKGSNVCYISTALNFFIALNAYMQHLGNTEIIKGISNISSNIGNIIKDFDLYNPGAVGSAMEIIVVEILKIDPYILQYNNNNGLSLLNNRDTKAPIFFSNYVPGHYNFYLKKDWNNMNDNTYYELENTSNTIIEKTLDINKDYSPNLLKSDEKDKSYYPFYKS